MPSSKGAKEIWPLGGGFGSSRTCVENVWSFMCICVTCKKIHALIHLSPFEKNSHTDNYSYHKIFCAYDVSEAERPWNSMLGLPPRTLFPFLQSHSSGQYVQQPFLVT